jgi:hypothetical protein
MTLLWIEGFESFGTTNGVAPVGLDRKYDANSRVPLTDVQAGRIAGKSWYGNTGSSPTIITPNLGAQTGYVTGFGWKFDQQPTTDLFLNSFDSAGAQAVNFRSYWTGSAIEIRAYRGGTLLGTSSGASLAISTWYFIEFKVTIHNSTGTVDIKVDGSDILNLSSQDTQVGTPQDTVKWSFTSSGATPRYMWYDDWYICNLSGSQNNDFLGDHRVDLLVPNAAGDSTDWTPDTGNNWDRVNENPADDDTTYVESNTSTDRDLYNYQSTPTVSDVKGVQLNTVVRETDADIYSLKHVAKSSTTTDVGSAQVVGSGASYTSIYKIYELNPHTSSAWTDSELNSAQFGIEVA